MKNKYQIEGNTVRVFFRKTEGYFVIDKEDLPKVSRYTWHLNMNGYVETGAKVNGKFEHIKLHHVVLGKPSNGLVTDHINRNPLDNRKENLRHVTPRINVLNRSVSASNKMKGIRAYKGKKGTTYYVDLHDNKNKTIHIGRYKSLEEAMKERDKAYEQIWKQ